MRTLRVVSVFCAAVLAFALVAGCDDGDDGNGPGGTTAAFCGDGVCDWLGDEPGICFEDCSYCGDSLCSDEDEVASCQYDCAECGDGVCGDGELGVCVRDCHQCSSEMTWYYLVSCDDPNHCPPEWPCEVCGDGECTWMEAGWCPDCDGDPVCGDGECAVWEIGTCPDDCDSCGDGTCGDGEMNCPRDCAECGDGVCEVTLDFSEADYCNFDCRG